MAPRKATVRALFLSLISVWTTMLITEELKKKFLMWEYFVFLVNKKFFLMCEFFFFSEWSRWPWSPLFGRVFFPDFISCIIYFIVKKKKDRKMLMWIKRSFVWLKKIALDEYFYEIVFFSHVVAFCSCGGLGKCFVWFEVFFIFSTTRLDSMKYNHSFFPRCCERESWLCAGKMRIYIYFWVFYK